MNRNGILLILFALPIVFAAGTGSLGQTAAPVAPVVDPATVAAAQAFDTLTIEERRAVQDALVWTGDFQGVINGSFGKRTMDAMITYAKRLHLPPDGTLDATARAGLAAAAQAAKAAIKFGMVTEKSTGITVGVPAKLLSKITPSANGVTYEAPDGSAKLETSLFTGGDLAAQFETMKMDGPGRKVTYKFFRPEFFVVSGESSGQSFYTRMALAQQKGTAVIKGFSFSYVTAKKSSLDRVTIAIANSFVPSDVPAATVQAVISVPVVVGPKPRLSASGLAVSDHRVLAALPLAGCVDPMVGSVKAVVSGLDKESGLAVLDAPGLNAKAVVATSSSGGEVVVFSFDDQGAANATVGEWLDVTPARLRVALANGYAGGVAFDRGGALAGFVAPLARASKFPPSVYALVRGGEISKLPNASGNSKAVPPLSVGEIITQAGSAVVAISCTI